MADTITMYEVRRGDYTEIRCVKCSKVTDTSVWMASTGSRRNRSSYYGEYLDTWRAAHANLISWAQTNMRYAENAVEKATERLILLQSMTDPTSRD